MIYKDTNELIIPTSIFELVHPPVLQREPPLASDHPAAAEQYDRWQEP